MPGSRSQDADSVPAVRLNPFKRQAYANAKQAARTTASNNFLHYPDCWKSEWEKGKGKGKGK